MRCPQNLAQVSIELRIFENLGGISVLRCFFTLFSHFWYLNLLFIFFFFFVLLIWTSIILSWSMHCWWFIIWWNMHIQCIQICIRDWLFYTFIYILYFSHHLACVVRPEFTKTSPLKLLGHFEPNSAAMVVRFSFRNVSYDPVCHPKWRP